MALSYDRVPETSEIMRYVIGVCLLTGFIVWDAVDNDGRYLDMSIRQVRHVLNMFGAHV